MASADRRLRTNVPGDWYVDDSCIDCDTCRWMAPAVFDEAGGYSRVHTQPTDSAMPQEALLAARKALLACPTGSIGAVAKQDLTEARASFPDPIGPDCPEVRHCGYHHRDSFGAASYLLVRQGGRGNVLIDSPRFVKGLVRALEELGGVRWMFLTHRDDVAEHARFAEHFGCERVMHADDVGGSTRDVEIRLSGEDPLALAEDLLVVPTPGHTAGSACLIAGERYLFSGDHVAWSDSRERVIAFRGACWYDWDLQIDSMQRLAEHRFEWILPGHGRRVRLPPDRMAAEMRRCVQWMKTRR